MAPKVASSSLVRHPIRCYIERFCVIKMFSYRNEKLIEAYTHGYKPTGRDYEYYLAYELQNMGYQAWVTPATGDFGTDVILQINRYFRVIFQCKYYSSKIGNHAVQEICAAKEYYKAQMCVVITNQDYTDAAIALASANNIMLISNFDIGSSVEDLCVVLGLIPARYFEKIRLQLNDASAERDELAQQVRGLQDELFEYKVDSWNNEPYDLYEDDDLNE